MKKLIFAVSAYLILSALPVLAQSAPPEIVQQIKQHYAEKYQDNYSMQAIMVEAQLDAYAFLQDYDHVDGVPDDVISRLKAKYLKKYPLNFSMQKTMVTSQVKHYIELN
jgi:hypothetical protein